MKIAFKKTLLATSLALTSFVSIADDLGENWSANVGLVSQYFFRGIAQTETASASAGLDYEYDGIYVGTWVADVQDGLEIDIYAGYGYETEGGLGLSIGATTYQYTGLFDSAYNELNLGASYSFLSLEYSVGTHEDDEEIGIEESDYDFIALTAEYEGFYATVGSWGKDFDGDYFEVGYGTEVGGFDVGVSLIKNSEELDVETFDGEDSLVFSIGKTF
ncbi:TorF family putative porin [Thalassotalea maritima]|uniref:TorF family putative porin n=1 Tax=Thalassotalea maritima TaxID=3242416 RepID=UPI0035279BB8